jgi:glucose/mannose-6-phosphate isomerase
MLTPLALIADALGLASFPASSLAQAADLLDDIAVECGPASVSDDNRAKLMAQALSGSLPMVWGTGPLGSVAAYRMACQLNENAKLPVVQGSLPEVNHNQVVSFDGRYAPSESDIFYDPDLDGVQSPRLHLVVIRDAGEHEQDARRADISAGLARSRGIAVETLRSGDENPFVRLASLIGVIDWISVYSAIVEGVDPTPIGPIVELKERII